jgi:hypothetical protein
MSDDIETLRDALLIIAGEKQCLDNLMGNADVAREAIAVLDRLDFNFKSQANEIEIADATIDRLKTDHDSLRKALDDRHAADKKAWSAIMRATGKERGLPDNKEVIAFYVAEVERLEARVKYLEGCKGWANITAERDSLRAKLAKAREVARDAHQFGYCTASGPANHEEAAECDRLEEEAWSEFVSKSDGLSELSADAPAQPPANYNPVGLGLVREKLGRISSNFSDDPRGDADAALDALDKFCGRAPPQISDDVRSLLDEAIAALGGLNDSIDSFWNDPTRPSITQMRGNTVANISEAQCAARATFTKLRAARNA